MTESTSGKTALTTGITKIKTQAVKKIPHPTIKGVDSCAAKLLQLKVETAPLNLILQQSDLMKLTTKQMTMQALMARS